MIAMNADRIGLQLLFLAGNGGDRSIFDKLQCLFDHCIDIINQRIFFGARRKNAIVLVGPVCKNFIGT